ncbi:hypothetical protein A9Q91_02440 [Candidatus Gracilibacteria bacterium 28_42_T64]|nr:hypothetical protein A9Q91_02440 [Candidatus Gracilibacteria bacterium 28_42_T64]
MANKNKDENMLDELFEDFTEVQKKEKNNQDKNIEKLDPKKKKKQILILVVLLIAVLVGYFFYLESLENSETTVTQDTIIIDTTDSDYENNVGDSNDVKENPDTDYSIELKARYKKLYSLFIDRTWVVTARSDFTNVWGDENIEQLEKGGLKISYPKGSYKPSADPRGGAGFIYHIGDDYKKLKFSYDLEFAPNFDFVKGGKLPGLCGGDCARGGENANNGFSIRFAWKKDGYLDTLSSIPGASKYGSYSGKKLFKFEAGKNYNISQEIILNTPGKNDGSLIVMVDGSEVYKQTDLLYRNNGAIQLDSILFSTFFGGSDISWATPVATYIKFRNFKMSK